MGSWPAAVAHAVHPHQLVLLRYNRNYCDLCGGPLVGKLGYRCEPCDFDVHCTCLLLPNNTTGTTTTIRRTSAHQAPPPPPSSPWHHHHHHAPQPSLIYYALPTAATGHNHPVGAQTSPVSPALSNHHYYHHQWPRPGASYPQSYDHHLQQQNYPTTNNQQGGYDVPDQQSFDYLYDYTGTRDSGDVDYPLDDMGNYDASWF